MCASGDKRLNLESWFSPSTFPWWIRCFSVTDKNTMTKAAKGRKDLLGFRAPEGDSIVAGKCGSRQSEQEHEISDLQTQA